MKLVTWNIQWGLGCDGNVDLARIVSTAKALCDADVFCFQEISRGFTEYDFGEDQPARWRSCSPAIRPFSVRRSTSPRQRESGRYSAT